MVMRKFLAILLQSMGVILIVLFLVSATIASHLHFSYIQLPLSHYTYPALSTLALSAGLIGAGKWIDRGGRYSGTSNAAGERFLEYEKDDLPVSR
jgi:hypothetical protein